ncbi:transposase [Streptomonospora alba]|uniref:Transposase n=1 Tax=Streptomonospora alba TaxID=183763 RepID=A0A0C2FB97_9ACTN|nr:transposase [Streptomonospora alba]KIH96389.1 transposase [Streptomonospora alba]
MPSPHSPEFRRRAVELARQGSKSTVELAKDLGISRSCLQNRVAQAAAEEKAAGDAARPTSAEKKELAELRRRNKQLESENQILKRAAAYFASENVLPK